MLPFQALLFHLRIIVEGPCFIASDDSLQGDLSFVVKLIKEFPGNFREVLLVLRCKHLRYPAIAHLGKFEYFTDYDDLYLWICPAAGLFFNSYLPFSNN